MKLKYEFEITAHDIALIGLGFLGGLISLRILACKCKPKRRYATLLRIKNQYIGRAFMPNLQIGYVYPVALVAAVSNDDGQTWQADEGATFTNSTLTLSGPDSSPEVRQLGEGAWELDLSNASVGNEYELAGTASVTYSDGFTENVAYSGNFQTVDEPGPTVLRRVSLEIGTTPIS